MVSGNDLASTLLYAGVGTNINIVSLMPSGKRKRKNPGSASSMKSGRD